MASASSLIFEKGKKNRENDVFTVAIGGAAGDGVREAGMNLGQLLTKMGFEVFVTFEYPTLIRGGHNFSRVTFSKSKVYATYESFDVLVALNDETLHIHRNQLNKDAVIFADQFDDDDKKFYNRNAVQLPMLISSQEINAIPITRSSVGLGAVCYLLDLDFKKMAEVLHQVFKEKSLEANIALAIKGYKFLSNLKFRHSKRLPSRNEHDKELIDGNTAYAKGLVAAGLDFYIAYPMTPSTSILHYLAKIQKDKGIKVIQPENEISVINMALGTAYAGKRTALGTAGGGFALMQETFSLAGQTEIPIALGVCQRKAPATGDATGTGQGDLLFTINSGTGEFPRIVIAPGDSEEAFYAAADSLNLAWEFQIPVVVLLDKQLSESASTSLLYEKRIMIHKGKTALEIKENYNRYEITHDGISPMAFPGTKNAVIKVTSYDHDESGITTQDPLIIKMMQEKRFEKSKQISKDFEKYPTYKLYGDLESKTLIVFWGSTKSAMLEALKHIKEPVKLLQIIWMEPFNTEKISEILEKTNNIIDVECNETGQLAALIRQKTGLEIKNKILKYDGRAFEPMALAKKINSLIS